MKCLYDSAKIGTSSEEAHDILKHLAIHRLACISRLRACVWRHTYVVEGVESRVWVVLLLEDIESSSHNSSLLQCPHEGFFIDDRTASCIDEDRCWLHLYQLRLSDEVVCVCAVRSVDGDEV